MESFMFKRLQFTSDDTADEGLEMDGDLPVVPSDRSKRATDLHIHRELFFQLAGKGGGGRFARINLTAGKFPEAAEVFSRGTKAGEKPAF